MSFESVWLAHRVSPGWQCIIDLGEARDNRNFLMARCLALVMYVCQARVAG